MKKTTLLEGRKIAFTISLFILTFFLHSGIVAQNPGCTPTAGFPDPPASLTCTGGFVPQVVLTETFDTGFGIFTEDSPPGPGTTGANDLTLSTNGDTPSFGTGSECNPEAMTGPEYVFLEGSFTLAGETHCMTASMDLTAESAPLAMSFWYYMFGDNIGTLEIFVNGVSQWSIAGQQQFDQTSDWLQGDFDLSAFAGQVIDVRVCMTEGNGAISTFESDTSIDHMQVWRCAPPPPVIACPTPDPLVASTEPGVCTAQVTFSNAVAFDPDGGPVTVVQTMGPPSGSDFPIGDTIIEFTATDDEGDTASCQFTITVEDNEPPTITCPADIVVDNDPGTCGAVVTYPGPTVMDNCFMGGGTVMDELSTTFAGGNGLGANATVYFDATIDVNDIMVTEIDINTDATAGNTVNADIYLISGGTYVGNETDPGAWGAAVVSASGPSSGTNNPTTLTLAAPITLNANTTYAVAVFMDQSVNYTNGNGANEQFSNSDLTLDLGSATSGLFTGSVFSPRVWNGAVRYEYTVSNAPYTVITGFPSGDVFPVGTTLTTLEYTDPGGNSVQCTFNVTVNDIEAPTVSCVGQPGTYDTTINITEPALMTTNLFSFMGTPTGAVADGTLEVRTFGDIDGTGGNEEAWTITDEDGGTTGLIGATGDFGDQCNTTLMETFTIPAALINSWAADGQIDFTGTDVAGNINLSLCGGDFLELRLFYDTPGGTPFDVVLDPNGMASIPASMLVTNVDDNCGPGGVVVTGGSPGGDPFSLETTFAGGNGNFGNMFDINALNPVTIDSFDIHGDTGATFDVEVYAKSGTWVGSEDNPAAWTLIGTAPGVVSNGDGVATPLNLMLNYTIPAGETHAFYVTPTDFSTGGFNYTNGTAVGTVFASDANIEFLEGAGKGYPFTGTTFQPRVFNGNIHYTAGGAGGTTIDFTCDDVGEQLITITATDAAGNESTCIATVNVIDDTPPVLVCQDVTIEIGPEGTTEINPEDLLASSPTTYEVISISSDNGSGTEGFTDFEVNVTAAETVSFDWDYTTMDGPAFDSFGYLINGVFTELTDPAGGLDQSGNSGPINLNPGDVFGFRSQSDDGIFGPATTTISNFMPGFNGQFDPANWFLTLTNSDGDAFFVEIPGGPLSFDACGIDILAVDIDEVSCDDIANSPLTITVFAADPSLNTAACQSMVTVVDALGPEVVCPEDQTVDPGPGNLFYTLPDYWAEGLASATDNCTDPLTIFSQNPAAGTELPDGVYTIEICSTDEYGNQGCCTFELTVESILGADDNELNSAISMYPNPAQEYVTIYNGSNILLENAMIFDVNGKLINTIDLRDMQSEKVIDVSSLASGVYMVQITGERSSVVKRLLVE